MKLIDAIMNGDAQAARSEFTAAINDKVSTVLDIRRVAMASDVFNQVKEAAQPKKEMLNPDVTKNLPEQEDDLEEAQTPGQKFDFQKVLHGAMSQDEYNKKYKLGKYRPAGNKLAGPGGLYKNLVKKP